MKAVKQFLKTILQGLFEYLLFLPIFLLAGILLERYFSFSLSLWLAIIPTALILGIIYRTIFQNQKWWTYLSVAIMFGLMPLLFLSLYEITTWILVILLPIISFRGMLYASRTWLSLLSIYFLWTGGFLIYFVSYFLFRYVEMFSPYLYFITVGGALLVLVTLFISNDERLRKSTLERNKTPYISKTIKRQNKTIIFITIGLIVLGNLKVVQKAFKEFIGFFVRLIFKSGPIEELPPEEELPPGGGIMLPDDGEGPKTSQILKILEVIVLYITYIGLILGLILLVLLFIKKGRKWLIEKWHALIQILKNITNRSSNEEKAPYIDEKETVFDWDLWKKNQQNKAKTLLNKMFRRKPNWDTLSVEEKVRFIYRHVVQKQMNKIDYTAALTPREVLDKIKDIVEKDDKEIDLLRKYYEKIRYSENDVHVAELAEIYALIKK